MNDVLTEQIRRAIAGEESALVEVLEAMGPSLHAEIGSRIGAVYRGVVEADDIFQVTCVEAFLRVRTFSRPDPGAFRGWLSRIAENNLKDAIKELERDKRPSPRQRLRDEATDESYVDLIERLAATTTTPSRVCACKEVQEAVDKALRELPEDYERVLRLYELEGLSGVEIAELTGRTHGAVRMLLARARERLTEVLLENSVLISGA